MQIINTTPHTPLPEQSALALGTFDGLHRGHQDVINTMLREASANRLLSAVFTFSDIPKHVLNQPTSRIMSDGEKLKWLRQTAVDYCIHLPFDDRVKEQSPSEFFSYLIKSLRVAVIVVGDNFHFGKDAKGTTMWLRQQCELNDIQLIVVPPVIHEGRVISSSWIRNLLLAGDIGKANQLLGRPYFVSGTVKVGKQVGRSLGFATANLTIGNHMTNIKPGVYITATQLDDNVHPSVSNVGYNPTFNQREFNLETYILNFDQNLYDQRISVHFLKRLRDELRFDSHDELSAWIARDVANTKAYFAAVDSPLDGIH